MKKNNSLFLCCLILLSCTLILACTGNGNNGASSTPSAPSPSTSTPSETTTPVVDKPTTKPTKTDPSDSGGSPAKPSEAGSTDEAAAEPEIVKSEDGKCYYAEFKGLAKIKSVSEAPAEADNCPDAVLVEFTFGPINTSDTQKYRYTLFKDDEQYLTIHGGMNPSKAWVTRMGIQEGTILTCSRKELVQGECSKVMFDFPEIEMEPKEHCQ